MTPEQAVETLVANYTHQLQTYQALREHMQHPPPAPTRSPGIIEHLRQRNILSRQIEDLDREIKEQKIIWERHEGRLVNAEAKMLRSILKQIHLLLGEILVLEKDFETRLGQSAYACPIAK